MGLGVGLAGLVVAAVDVAAEKPWRSRFGMFEERGWETRSRLAVLGHWRGQRSRVRPSHRAGGSLEEGCLKTRSPLLWFDSDSFLIVVVVVVFVHV